MCNMNYTCHEEQRRVWWVESYENDDNGIAFGGRYESGGICVRRPDRDKVAFLNYMSNVFGREMLTNRNDALAFRNLFKRVLITFLSRADT